MGIIIRQSIKSTVVSYIGVLLGAFNALWLYPKFLEPEKIGVIRLLQDIPALLALFAQLGASSLIDRYFHYFKDEKNKNNGFLNILTFYPLIGFSLFLFTYFVFNDFWRSIYEAKSNLLLDYFIYLIPLTFFMMYTSIMESYLRAHLNVSFATFIREVFVRILYTMFTLVYVFKLISFDHLILLITAGYAISLIILYIHAYRLGILLFLPKIKIPPRKMIKEMLIYVSFLIPGTAGSIIAHKIDNLMLGAISGAQENEGLRNVAIYSLAYFIGSVVEIPRKSITQISIPILSNAFKENDLAQIDSLYKKNSLVQLLTGSFIFLLIWINVDDLFVFIPKSEIYFSGKFVILFIGLSRLFDMITSINGEIIQFSKHYKFNMFALVFLAIVSVVTCLLFIPQYKVTGAAISLSITLFMFNGLKTYYVWRTMKFIPFTKGMWPIILLCIITIAYTLYGSYQKHDLLDAFLFIVLRSVIFISIFYFLIRKFKISEDVNRLIDQTLTIVSEKTKISFIKKL